MADCQINHYSEWCFAECHSPECRGTHHALWAVEPFELGEIEKGDFDLLLSFIQMEDRQGQKQKCFDNTEAVFLVVCDPSMNELWAT